MMFWKKVLQLVFPKRPAILVPGWRASTRRIHPRSVTATYPALHKNVADALDNAPELHTPLFSYGIHYFKIIKDHKKDTNIIGRFTCHNPKCFTTGWSSKHIAIQIRGFRDNTYNTLVFKQRCRGCEHLGTMHIDESSYIERVAYRLKKWADVPVEPEYHEKTRLPHDSSRCEGCKAGCCAMLKTAR